jgi:hypothetical protein
VTTSFRRSRAILIAIVGLALSATLVFAAKPEGSGDQACNNPQSAAHQSDCPTTEPETPGTDGAEGAEQGTGDSDTKETEGTETETKTEDAGGDHCATNPTGLTDEQLAAMNHGSIVCWAAHQTSWPGYDNHGDFVSHWAHAGKDKTSQGKSAWGHSHKP